MSKRPWICLDHSTIDDERIVHLADAHGPAAIAFWVALLCVAKRDGIGGTVVISYGSLARKAFLESAEQAEELLTEAAEIGLVDLEPDKQRISVTIKRWSKYQRDPFHNERRREARDKGESTPTSYQPPTNCLPTETETKTETLKTDVQSVFEAWVEATERNPKQTRLTKQRRALIERRLGEYPPDDLIAACKGLGASEWHRGANERGKRYDSLELVLRDAEHIERFRDEHLEGSQPKVIRAGVLGG